MITIDEIFELIENKRLNQDIKWGEQNHSVDRWCSILGEEYGEVCKANLENDDEGYIEELVQVAATTVAMIESFYRNEIKQ